MSGRPLQTLQARGWPGEREKGMKMDRGVAVGMGRGLMDGGSLGRGAAGFQATEAPSSFRLRQVGESGQFPTQGDLGGARAWGVRFETLGHVRSCSLF